MVKLICGDCMGVMDTIYDNSIDLVVCDLPYGVTSNKFDKCLDLKSLWKQYNRILREKGTVVLTSQFPFTNMLINSNPKMFRYDLIWDKKLTSGFLNAKKMPLRSHEHILVFYKKHGTYNPQFEIGKPLHSVGSLYKHKQIKNSNYNEFVHSGDERCNETKKYPKSIISIQKPHPSKSLHPTEKPIELAEWIIKTYSNQGDLVLDNCMGVGWTAIACEKLKRKFIGIDINKEFIDAATLRLKKFMRN